MEIRYYKDLSVEDKKKYKTAIEKLRGLGSSFGKYQREDGSWTSNVMNVLWGVITPKGRVSKAYWQTTRYNMRKLSIDSIRKSIEKEDGELHKLPKGYKWVEPILFDWSM